MWQHTLLVPALWRQTRVTEQVPGKPELHTVRSNLKKQQQQTKNPPKLEKQEGVESAH